MWTIMNRNDKGVTEAEVIKSGGKNAQKKIYKKCLFQIK